MVGAHGGGSARLLGLMANHWPTWLPATHLPPCSSLYGMTALLPQGLFQIYKVNSNPLPPFLNIHLTLCTEKIMTTSLLMLFTICVAIVYSFYLCL